MMKVPHNIKQGQSLWFVTPPDFNTKDTSDILIKQVKIGKITEEYCTLRKEKVIQAEYYYNTPGDSLDYPIDLSLMRGSNGKDFFLTRAEAIIDRQRLIATIKWKK